MRRWELNIVSFVMPGETASFSYKDSGYWLTERCCTPQHANGLAKLTRLGKTMLDLKINEDHAANVLRAIIDRQDCDTEVRRVSAVGALSIDALIDLAIDCSRQLQPQGETR